MGNALQRLGIAMAGGLGLALCIGWGCASSLGVPLGFRYFATPPLDDAWSHKIESWQARERAERRAIAAEVAATPAVASGDEALGARGSPADLRAKFEAFRRDSRRAQARELAEWIQQRAREHYVADGPIDHWATLEETLRGNGDDCDGLELLVYQLLRDLGFGDDAVFRAIVYRRSDNQHHMVTFWFEDPNDPWVIDPTGAMTSGMPRMSEVPGWAPLKVFSEDSNFSVEPRIAQH